jgi:hypothetical protein
LANPSANSAGITSTKITDAAKNAKDVMDAFEGKVKNARTDEEANEAAKSVRQAADALKELAESVTSSSLLNNSNPTDKSKAIDRLNNAINKASILSSPPPTP